MIITIDGPSASGKSSVAQALAQKLNFYYLNTGLLYRAVAYVIFEKITSKKSHDLIFWLSKSQDFSFIEDLSYKYIDNKSHIFFHGHDITNYLSDSHIGQGSSIIAVHKEIREKLLLLQRSLGQEHSIVVDGRDCGSVVFPDAQYKFFLTASLEVRAQRELCDPKRNHQEQDQKHDLEQIKKTLQERDQRDREREIAPLIVPKGAITIDNSGLNLQETIDLFLSYIKNV